MGKGLDHLDLLGPKLTIEEWEKICWEAGVIPEAPWITSYRPPERSSLTRGSDSFDGG